MTVAALGGVTPPARHLIVSHLCPCGVAPGDAQGGGRSSRSSLFVSPLRRGGSSHLLLGAGLRHLFPVRHVLIPVRRTTRRALFESCLGLARVGPKGWP